MLRLTTACLVATCVACTYQPIRFEIGEPGDPGAGDQANGADGASGDNGPANSDGSAAQFRVGFTVAMPPGSSIQVALNDLQLMAIPSGGAYQFTTPLAAGATYVVRVSHVSDGIGCGVTHGSGTMPAADVTDVVVTCAAVSVAPIYTNAPNWLDFVTNNGADVYSATGATCPGSTLGPRGYYECLNGGQLRALALPMVASCADLVAYDTRGVFEWRCTEVGSSGGVIFRSFLLQPGMGLADLIQPGGTTFAPMAVTVSKGPGVIARSTSSIWWFNDLVPVTASSTGLGSIDKAIFTVAADLDRTLPLELISSRIALVTLPGAALRGTGGSDENLVHAQDTDWLWVEGTFDLNAGGQFARVFFEGQRYLTARNVTVLGNRGPFTGSARGLDLCGSTAGLFENVRSQNNVEHGVVLNGGQLNTFRGLRIANTADPSSSTLPRGLAVRDACGESFNNTFADVVIANTGGIGLVDLGTAGLENRDNRFIGLTVLGSDDDGVWLAKYDLLVNATLLNAGDVGLAIPAVNGVSVMNLISSGNGTDPSGAGVHLDVSTNFTFHNVAVPHNSTGLSLFSSSYGYFSGKIVTGYNSANRCWVSGSSTLPGVGNATCAGQPPSTATVTYGIDLNAALVLRPMTDTAHPAATTGKVLFVQIADWTSFERPHRGFGADADEFPSVIAPGACVSGSACRIWDASCLTGATPICAALSLPTGADVLKHLWSASTSAECDRIAGARWTTTGVCIHPGYTDQASCTTLGTAADWTTPRCVSIYLQNAVELPNDLLGNDNGLCESGEHCLYTPNIGAYQGHGPLVYLGPITDGTITGVTLWRYNENGYSTSP